MSYGDLVQDARRQTYLDLGAFTANTAVVHGARFGCPVGIFGLRILAVHLCCNAVPSDSDGTLVFDADAKDISEGAVDALVDAEDLETLVTAADQWFECTLETEGSERELTLYEGDSVKFTLTSDSAAIDTNPNVTVCVEWMPLPYYADISRVGHASQY